jgi:hypothetical protein
MKADAAPAEGGAYETRALTRLEKLKREYHRIRFQVNTLLLRPLAMSARNEFLFVLGHMRSGSSLLCHLLCSSEEILGYGETHQDYHRRSDLAKLMLSVRMQTGKNPLQYRYVLDKIVTCHHVVTPTLLTDPRTRYVFLIREPLPSIASIVAMHRDLRDEPEEQLLAGAVEHYTLRLTQLVELAQTIDDPDRCMLITHRQMLNDTDSVFSELESFLDLSAPLREDYDIMPTTGKPGIGDPSPNILSGKIDRSLPRKFISLSAQEQQRLSQRYEQCLGNLTDILEKPVMLPLAGRKMAA